MRNDKVFAWWTIVVGVEIVVLAFLAPFLWARAALGFIGGAWLSLGATWLQELRLMERRRRVDEEIAKTQASIAQTQAAQVTFARMAAQTVRIAPRSTTWAPVHRHTLHPEHDTEAPVTPDSVTPLKGWRWFGFTEGRLQSPMYAYRWTRGENVAICGMFGGVRGAAKDCHCGFYALYAPPPLFQGVLGVLGQIEGYGRVQRHTEGFRAEKARIVALAYTPHAYRTETRIASALYRVPIIERPPNEHDYPFKVLGEGGAHEHRTP